MPPFGQEFSVYPNVLQSVTAQSEKEGRGVNADNNPAEIAQ